MYMISTTHRSRVGRVKHRSCRVLVDAQTQLIRSAVVAHNVEVLLRLGLHREIDIGVEDALLARGRTLDELITHRGVDHAESASAARRAVRVAKVLDPASLLALLADHLRADHHEAGPFEGDDLRESHAHHIRDVAGPVRLLGTILGSRVRPEDGPARNVQVDILLVLVVPQHDLGVFPAVEAADLDIRMGCAGDHGLERFALSVTPVGALDVGRLDLAAMVHDDAVLVDERLTEKLVPCIAELGDASACLSDVQGVLIPLAIPEDDKDSGFLDGGADSLHLIRVLDKGVAEVLVHEAGIFRGRLGPDAPLDVSN